MNIAGMHSALTGHTTMSADDPRLKSAAHEFEASLMQEFLKPLQHDSLFSSEKSGDSDDSDNDEGSSGALMSFGSEALAKAISERGGFGIATKILDHFKTDSKTESGAKTQQSEGVLRTNVSEATQGASFPADKAK